MEHDGVKSKTFEFISPQSDKEDPWPKMGESQGRKNHEQRSKMMIQQYTQHQNLHHQENK